LVDGRIFGSFIESLLAFDGGEADCGFSVVCHCVLIGIVVQSSSFFFDEDDDEEEDGLRGGVGLCEQEFFDM
jgi:hypothetical protein